jgi:hypothetical protein
MKTQANWVVKIGWRMPRIKVDGDICLRRPRPTQDCKAKDDDDDDDNDEGYEDVEWTHLAQSSVKLWPLVTVATGISLTNTCICSLNSAG